MLPRILAISAFAAAACFGQPLAISLERPAAVGMPVWLKIPATNRGETFYPFWLGFPASFGCKQVEVRRNGQMLPDIANLADQEKSAGVMIVEGNPCGSASHDWSMDPARATHPPRLPLHLRYRFDKPGVYEVRYTARTEQFTFPPGPAVWSAWTAIEIQPGSPESRASWLAEMSTHAPTDAVEALTDFLPGILGVPDPESLRLLGPYLHHPNEVVRRYAGAGLAYWPCLRSDSPVLAAGALAAAWHLTGSSWIANPELRRRAEQDLMDAQDHVRAVCDSGTAKQVDSLLEVLPRLR